MQEQSQHASTSCLSIFLTNHKTNTLVSHGITDLSFSHDGEYIAMSNQGSYIDIVGSSRDVRVHLLKMNSAQRKLVFPSTAYLHSVRHPQSSGTRQNMSSPTAGKPSHGMAGHRLRRGSHSLGQACRYRAQLCVFSFSSTKPDIFCVNLELFGL